jgi:hypothetical protein
MNRRGDEVSTGSDSDRVPPLDISRLVGDDPVALTSLDTSETCGRFLFALKLGKAKSKE